MWEWPFGRVTAGNCMELVEHSNRMLAHFEPRTKSEVSLTEVLVAEWWCCSESFWEGFYKLPGNQLCYQFFVPYRFFFLELQCIERTCCWPPWLKIMNQTCVKERTTGIWPLMGPKLWPSLPAQSLGVSCQRSAGIKIYLLHTKCRNCALNHNMELFVSGSLCCYLCLLSGACESYSFSHLNLSRSSSGLFTRDAWI